MAYTKYGGSNWQDGGLPAIQAAFLNGLENYLNQIAGATETGKYVLAGPIYGNGALISIYRATMSQGKLIASVSVDTADLAPAGGVTGTPSTGQLSTSGFQIYSLSTTGPNVNARCGGNFTATF